MKISAKIDYACRALVELGLHWPDNRPMQVSAIAKRQKIPMNFLVHILITLKELGYVDSIRGKSGGYVLLKSPQEIRMSDVFKSFGGLGFTAQAKPKTSKNANVMDGVWHEINDAVLKAMDALTLETICNRERSRGSAINYDI